MALLGRPMTQRNALQVSFPRRDPVQLTDALQRSHAVLWVRNLRQTRWARMGQLIGFARATSDGVCAATIWDVAVSAAWYTCMPCPGLHLGQAAMSVPWLHRVAHVQRIAASASHVKAMHELPEQR